MKIKDKYPRLRDRAFVRDMIVGAVYASMLLERQGVDKARLYQLYDEISRSR